MGLVFVKSDNLPNWFMIQTDKPEYSQMVQTGPNSAALWISNRVSDACVEGNIVEMLCLARAIRGHSRFEADRLAVDARNAEEEDDVLFWSPRNSQMRGVFTLEEAMDLSEQIQSMATPEDLEAYKVCVLLHGL